MTFDDNDKVECRTPAAGRNGTTRIPRWKYESVRQAILRAMAEKKPDPVGFKELRQLAKTHMTNETLASVGSWGWHFTTVKLNMEAEGELLRADGVSPQQLILGK